MKRVFSSPITALLAGACLRLFFILQFPAGSGDTVIYEQLATNWLKLGKYAMNIAGQPVLVDIRVPGYPAFLAMIYALTGRTGEDARLHIMIAQVVLDLATCILIGALAALLSVLCNHRASAKRVFVAGLWLAVLCPFTANYAAVPLTEVWALLFTTAAFLLLALVATRARNAQPALLAAEGFTERSYWMVCALAGLIVGVGTLFRPETPLLLVTSCVLLSFWLLRRGEIQRWFLTCTLMIVTCALPLAPWAVRNAVTFHEFQPLAPKDATLPGEVDPKGFMAWERTWLFRFRDCYLVPWKLNDESINLEDIPPAAFDTAEEKDRVAAVLEQYNDELTWTVEEDAIFAKLARERTARHPLRTYLWIPLRRAVRIWFTPRIELIPISGHVFPLAAMWETDPVDQGVTIFYFVLNIVYLLLAFFGLRKLWQFAGVRTALLIILLYIFVRTAFLTTLETPEPRYVLVCFPALLAFAAQFFAGEYRAETTVQKT